MKFDLVKSIAGVLTNETELLGQALLDMEPIWGKADIIGEWLNFDHTTYYNEEMGEGLKRIFVSFENLVAPEKAGNFKLQASLIEDKFRKGGVDKRRRVNIDPGYLDANKVVLITGKHGGHKIALATNIWADFLLWYNKGWVALPWAFPDFRSGQLFPVFMKMRRRFKQQIKILSF